MTIMAPELPTTLSGRLHGMLTDAGTVAWRDLIHWRRDPARIWGSLLYTVISVLLFGYVFGSAMSVPGGGNYREFLMPGMFAMTMMFGIGETATGVATDAAKGVTDRFRSMPMSQVGVVAGRSLADMVNALAGIVLLVACGLAVGWRWHGGLGQALAAVGLLLLLRFAFIWVGIYLGLVLPSPEAVAAMYGLLFPVTMIANTFVAPELMPGWLGAIADWNPLSATVTASRELFGTPASAAAPGLPRTRCSWPSPGHHCWWRCSSPCRSASTGDSAADGPPAGASPTWRDTARTGVDQGVAA
jgi:ABC-2 type transport system permease protein